MNHSLYVATRFKPWTHEFWLGLFHDSVEDGYLPRKLCEYWPALDAITRREGEQYNPNYLSRVKANKTARLVKQEDIKHNIKRGFKGSLSLQNRYVRAQEFLR